jgi:hypothetical protein
VPARKANSAEKTALKESEHFTVKAPIINYFAINGMHNDLEMGAALRTGIKCSDSA